MLKSETQTSHHLPPKSHQIYLRTGKNLMSLGSKTITLDQLQVLHSYPDRREGSNKTSSSPAPAMLSNHPRRQSSPTVMDGFQTVVQILIFQVEMRLSTCYSSTLILPCQLIDFCIETLPRHGWRTFTSQLRMVGMEKIRCRTQRTLQSF